VSGSPSQLPSGCGPAVTTTAGLWALIAPISCAGTVLSHPPSNTTASIGLETIICSTSIAIRLRSSSDDGRVKGPEIEIVGNTTGKPPASLTPRVTAAATVSRPALHGLSSLHDEQRPITGRCRTSSADRPRPRRKARWMKPSTESSVNNAAPRAERPPPVTTQISRPFGARLARCRRLLPSAALRLVRQ